MKEKKKTLQSIFEIGDQVIVPAPINGYGFDIIAIVSDIEFFAGEIYISVTFVSDSPCGRRGGCYFERQIEPC